MKQGLNHNFNLGSDVLDQPVHRLQHGVAEQRRRAGKVAVRQALSYGINRTHLIPDDGGPTSGPPLTHVLPAGINGSQDVPASYNPYPYNPTKAKQCWPRRVPRTG